MVLIPANIFYFILGFISCFILFIFIAIYMVKKDEKMKKQQYSDFMELLSKTQDDKDTDE